LSGWKSVNGAPRREPEDAKARDCHIVSHHANALKSSGKQKEDGSPLLNVVAL
jgi:hypothetical protein